jgi:putative ABC transport system permease protein
MFKLTMRGLWARKRRLAGTFIAVTLGVAFLAGTQILGDTMRGSFDNLFTDAYSGTDAVVRNSTDVSSGGSQRGSIPASVLDTVKGVPGVKVAEPDVGGSAVLIDKKGDAVTGQGPRLAGNWVDDPVLNAWTIAKGHKPEGPGQVVIDKGSADDAHLHVGDRTTILVPDKVPVTIVGIAKFRGEDRLGGASFVGMTLDDAQRYLVRGADRISGVTVRADPGVSQDEIVGRISKVLPAGVEAIGGKDLTTESINDVNDEFLNTFRIILTVFAGIALLVAVFSIHNTFAILVAQRTRESALLRAVGASRRQVLAGVVIEALTIGLAASIIGIFAGLGVAAGLKGLFSAFGIDLPATGIVFKGSTIAIALPVGVLVTLVAAITPALKASRVAPLAALREVAVEDSAATRRRSIVGIVLSVLGAAVTAIGASGGTLGITAIGGVVLLVGVVTLGPSVARPAANILGSPLPRVRGVTGGIARRNAARSPRRTAGAASALMVGVAVVTLFTVFAASLKASLDKTVAKGFTGDLVIEPGGFSDNGMPPQLAKRVQQSADVQTAMGIGAADAKIGGSKTSLSVVDPTTIGAVLKLDDKGGSVERLAPNQIAVSTKEADKKHWKVGTVVPVTFPDGKSEQATIGAVYSARDIIGDYVIPSAGWDPHSDQASDLAVLIKLKPGTSVDTAKKSLKTLAAGYGKPKVEDQQEFVDSRAKGVDTLLGLIYVMLALAIAIALMGIANTLALAVTERTRELGILRAVGSTRRQLKRMIRYESVIVAVFGAIGGIALGAFLGWGFVQSLISNDDLQAFSAPVGQLITILIIGAIAGVLAAIRPARRAAKLDVLQAIGAE